MKILLLAFLLATLFATSLAACSKREAATPNAQVNAPAKAPIAAQPKAKLVPVPAEEPSDSVLRQLMFEQYAQIEDAGGLPLTATASNTNFILRVKLYDARKESCAPAPQARAGTYNCSMTIKLAIAANKDPANARPYEKSERISVKWDPSGKWVRG